MGQTLTIPQLDISAARWIEEEARRTSTPPESVARRLIYRGLELERTEAKKVRHHDLDSLAGTWSAEEADEFRRGVEEFDQIDPALWR